jgi:hypothetical protein
MVNNLKYFFFSFNTIMPRIIPISIKQNVIQDYLKGVARDKVAQNNGIGAGTVSTIVQAMSFDIPDIETQIHREIDI